MRGVKYDDKVLLIMWDKMRHFKSHYIYPSQETWLKWLRNQGGLDVCRRTFNRYMRNLQNRQIIGRIRRVKRDPLKGLKFATTLYSISWLGLYKLVRLGVITFKQAREYMRNSIPFKARMPKKEKKGVSPGVPGFYKEVSEIGDLLKSPG